jgi:aldose 1-epimerase
MSGLIHLAFGPWSARVAPGLGGALIDLRWQALDLLRPTPSEAIDEANVRLTACYPLAPYANRIAAGRFSFAGRDYRLAQNVANSPHPLHGLAWRRAWRLIDRDERHVALALSHRPSSEDDPDWPFAFEARQDLELGAQGLTARLTLTSGHAGPSPAGIGFHPFFRRRPGETLDFHADGAWVNGEDLLPLHRSRDEVWRFDPGRKLATEAIDNDFFGWDGLARLSCDHEPSIVLTARGALGDLRLYTPLERDYLAIEPVSHGADALNIRPERQSPMAILQPGESLSGEFSLSLEARQ